MQIFTSLDNAQLDGVWLTIGSFDGVHRGHQEISRRLVAGAHAQAAKAAVLTFYPHPAVVLRNLTGPYYLTTPDERANLIGKLGVDIVIIQKFDRELANTSARDFVLKLKERLGLAKLVVGHDFTLGRGREGDIPTLKKLGDELGFEVLENEAVILEGQVISSSQIRSALAAGNVELANDLLGRPYQVNGEVVPGDGRGKLLGVPTANLSTWGEQLVPDKGVYACRAIIGEKTYRAATSIGVRPTFYEDDRTQTVETYLLDFNGNLYGQQVKLDFIARLRGEEKFDTVQALVDQIFRDIAKTRQLVSEP